MRILLLIALLFALLPAPALAARNSKTPAVLPGPSLSQQTYKTVMDRKGQPCALSVTIYPATTNSCSAQPGPAVVLFFGGSWKSGHPAALDAHARYLAATGFTVILPDYRTQQRFGTTARESVLDARSAMRWVRTQAGSLHIDPDRIAAGGPSAGAHLALCTAMIDDVNDPNDNLDVSPCPAALLLIKPPVGTKDDFADKLLKGRSAEISPMRHIRPDLPPAILFHGTKDRVVPPVTIRDFVKAMRAADNRINVVLYPGRGHELADPRAGNHEDFRDIMEQAAEFLWKQFAP